jgi:hypothetical protein
MFFLDHSTSARGLITGLSLLIAELSLLLAELSLVALIENNSHISSEPNIE